MNYSANTIKVILDIMALSTFKRVKEWFQKNPDEPYCYWAKDNFIAIKDKDNIEILKAHPEIDDIDDHTIVQWDSYSDTVFLSKFCPKIRQGIRALADSGCLSNDIDGCHWAILPDEDNFKVLIYENKENM